MLDRSDEKVLNKTDELLINAIDIHCHSYPAISLHWKTRIDDSEVVQLAQKRGIRAIVFKSHFWPTIGKVYELQKLTPSIKLFGSITLNPCVGGIQSWVVEAAAKQGAKVVWMPTWSTFETVAAGWKPAHWRKELPRLQNYYTSNKGIEVIDSSGKLTKETVEVLGLIKEFDLVLSTGHLSLREDYIIAEECQRIGLKKLIFGHPLGHSVPPIDQLKNLASLGGYIEVCALSTISTSSDRRLHPDKIVEVIDSVGYDKFILSSDASNAWDPPGLELLRMLVGMLVYRGVDGKAIKTMVQENPAKLLDLDLKPL